MSDLYNQNESGLNPVDAVTGSKDIYFSQENFAKIIKDEKTATMPDAEENGKKIKKVNSVASTYMFFIIVIAISMLISVYAIF